MTAPLRTVLTLADRTLTCLLARLLPWSSRSLHDAWQAGYVEGARDAAGRR